MIVFSVFCGYLTILSFRKRDYLATIFGGILYLTCLIGLFFMLNWNMVEDSIILQINATMIAGLLILLSITSFWGQKPKNIITTQITKRFGFYWSPRQIFFITVPFSISSIYLLLAPNTPYVASGMTALGFGFLILIAVIITFKEPKLQTTETSENEPRFDSENNSRNEP